MAEPTSRRAIKPKPSYGLERVPFNQAAKRLRADDNLSGLKELAVAQVFPPVPKAHPSAELWQVLATAATQAAQSWWDGKGNCFEKVRKAISTAARGYRGRGGAAVDVTWRGAYSKRDRKFRSQEWTHAAAVELAGATATEDGGPEPGLDAPTSVEADDRDQRDADSERLAAFTRERAMEQQAESRADAGGVTIATGAAVLEGGAERTSHDGGHADDVRLGPKDDGESAYGVEGATRGLNTGRVLMRAVDIARAIATSELSQSDRGFLVDVERAGRKRYCRMRPGKHADIEARLLRIAHRLVKRQRELLAMGHEELQAAWVNGEVRLAEPEYFRGARVAVKEEAAETPAPAPAPPAVPRWRLAMEAHERKLRADIDKEQHLLRTWFPADALWEAALYSYAGPSVVHRDPLFTVTLGDGRSELQYKDALRRWAFYRRRLRAQGWDRPLITLRVVRSLLDDV